MIAGIKIIGGISEDADDDRDYGIFIRKVLSGGLAERDGKLSMKHIIVLICVSTLSVLPVTCVHCPDQLLQMSTFPLLQIGKNNLMQ